MKIQLSLILFAIGWATLVSGQSYCPLDTIPLTITDDTTWNTIINIENKVVINSGNTLTINSQGYVGFPNDAKLIIEPGGKLILNGGTLTNACGDLWGGIEVWGDPEATQLPANQGWLSVSNGGTIENAVVAVRVGSEDYANKGGGIVHTDDAILRNNRAGVIYHEYAGSNIGNFNLTTFETTAELVDSSLPEEHLRLLGVEGITINGCTFRNTRDGNTPYSQRGTGIISFDASYDVDHYCISQSMPCTQYQETVFDSLYYGIQAYALSTVLAPSVENTGFTHNFRGVYTSGITYALVKNCYFVINTPFATDGGYGLYLDNSTAYTIEENNFYSTMATPTGIGAIVHNSGIDPNEVYRNWFTNLLIPTTGEYTLSQLETVYNQLMSQVEQNQPEGTIMFAADLYYTPSETVMVFAVRTAYATPVTPQFKALNDTTGCWYWGYNLGMCGPDYGNYVGMDAADVLENRISNTTSDIWSSLENRSTLPGSYVDPNFPFDIAYLDHTRMFSATGPSNEITDFCIPANVMDYYLSSNGIWYIINDLKPTGKLFAYCNIYDYPSYPSSVIHVGLFTYGIPVN